MAGYREAAFQSQALNKNGIKTPSTHWTAKKPQQQQQQQKNMRNEKWKIKSKYAQSMWVYEVNRYEQKRIWAYKWSLLNRNVLLH